MAQRAQHHDGALGAAEVVAALPRFVHHHQRVRPHVAFGMPLRILGAVIERHHLGQYLFDDTEIARETKSKGRPFGDEQQLFHLSPDALGRQIVQWNAAADVGAGRFQRELEAGGKLHGAQHTQRVVAETFGIHDAQHPAFEVDSAVVRIEVLLRQRIPGNGVDGEVAPPRGFVERHVRIARDGEAAMPAAGLGLAAGQGHVDRAELVDGEGLPHGLDAAERGQQPLQVVLRNAEHLEVEILRRAAQQAIADEAANGQRASAMRAHGFGNPPRFCFCSWCHIHSQTLSRRPMPNAAAVER